MEKLSRCLLIYYRTIYMLFYYVLLCCLLLIVLFTIKLFTTKSVVYYKITDSVAPIHFVVSTFKNSTSALLTFDTKIR